MATRRTPADESPLARLANRPCGDGKPFLSAEEAEAGERLRADWTRAGMMPSVTQRWDRLPGTGGGGGAPTDWSDHRADCHRRASEALQAVGPELSGVLVDICCFLKGTELVERERRWPARSAKLLLKVGLAALARHYGLVAEAGTAGARTRSWRS